MSELLTAWLLTIALHGGAFLVSAWLIDRALQRRTASRIDTWRESLWRAALYAGVLTATLQVAAVLPSFGGRWLLATTSPGAPVATGAVMSSSASARSASLPASEPGVSRASSARPGVLPQTSSTQAHVRPSPRFVAALRNSSWSTWIVCAWLAGALIALVRVARGVIALRRALAAAVALDECATHHDAATLAQYCGAPAPRLLTLSGLASPLATSHARIVLPDWALVTLDRAQLRAMLAHEVAHLARRDPQWKLFAAFWLALFWFVPLARFAQRRLDELAELACDAFAARAVGGGRGLAECLAACAERHLNGPQFALAAAMATRESSFVQRIERLLEETSAMETNRDQPRISAFRIATLCAVAAGAVVLPGIGFGPPVAYAAQNTQPASRQQSNADLSLSMHSRDGSENTTISLSEDDFKFQASIEGKISFNAAENDVATLSSGGRASFAETRAGVAHRVEISEKAGQLSRRYFVGDVEQPWDDAARSWLAKLVLEVERSGVGADAREERLFAAGGAKRVLDEIEQMKSDYPRSLYLKLMLAHGKLAPAELDRAVKIAGAAQTDYERRQQMQAIFETQVLDAAQQTEFLRQARRFSSDYERAEFLVGLAPALVDSADVRQAWLDAALDVSSDYERRRTLTALLDRPALDDAQLDAVIKASGTMHSDYERRELLTAVIRNAHDTERLAPAYANGVQALGSAYERREALLTLIRNGKLGVRGTDAVLDAAAGIDSSYERREVLVALARAMPHESAQIARFRKVSEGLDEFDRREAERALSL